MTMRTMTMKSNDAVMLFRYVRPLILDLERFEIRTQATGGITFLFEIDQENSALGFTSAITRDDENFNYQISQDIVDGRWNKDLITWIEDYDRTLSLVDNVYKYLEGNIYSESDITLKSKLKIIKNNNALVNNTYSNIIKQIKEKSVKENDYLKNL
jgi:hypothetical protein